MTGAWLRRTGLLVPSLAWALSTQFGQMSPGLDCRHKASWTVFSCALLLAVSIAGLAVAWGARRRAGRTGRFIVTTGLLIALAFVFALLLQGVATMLLDPCQR